VQDEKASKGHQHRAEEYEKTLRFRPHSCSLKTFHSLVQVLFCFLVSNRNATNQPVSCTSAVRERLFETKRLIGYGLRNVFCSGVVRVIRPGHSGILR
jgi:hypothetical protein